MSIAETLYKMQQSREIIEKLDQLNNKLLFMEQVNMQKTFMEQTFETKLNRIEANMSVIRKDIDSLVKEIRNNKKKPTWLQRTLSKLRSR